MKVYAGKSIKSSIVVRLLRSFARDEKGVTAIEYCLIGGFLTICLVGALPSITTALTGAYSTIAGYFP